MAHDLAYYLSKKELCNNDIRYMSPGVIAAVIDATPQVSETTSLLERLYWLRNNLSAYPSCAHCTEPVTGFINSVKGYRTFCSRGCQRRSVEYAKKYKDTCQRLYGVDHSFQAKAVQAKRNSTNLDKYGDSHPNRWGSSLFRQHMLNKHGVENALQQVYVRQKVSDSLRKGYVETKLQQRLDEIFEQEDVKLLSAYTGHDQPLMWLHEACSETFYSNIADGKVPHCPKCSGKSRPEYLLYKHLVDILGHDAVKRNDRTLIKPLELDIYLPAQKLAIELNGMFWHSELFLTPPKARTYHLYKSELCKAQGVQLLQIFDIEWLEKRVIIESKFNHLLGKSERRYARNFNVVEVPHNIAAAFLNQNHLQGADKSAVRFGLTDEDGNLYSLMTFAKPRFSKRYEWELSRFSNEVGYAVVGAASRLLKAFEQAYKPKSLITYADVRYSAGQLYKNLGFTFEHLSEPNYWYVRGGEILSRYQAQKHKLQSLLGDKFDSSLSERANMNANKWYAVYDCGNYVFSKHYA